MFTDSDLNRLFRYCLSLPQNEDDAMDLLQLGLEKFLKVNPGAVSHPVNYTFRIIRNQFIDDYRLRNKRGVEEYNEFTTVVDMEFKSLEDLYLDRDELKFLLDKMAPLERELLYFWAVEEYTLDEISQLFQIPKGTLVSKIHRMRKKMQAHLAQQDPLEAGL